MGNFVGMTGLRVLLDLAKLDRTRNLARVTTDDAGGYRVFGALVRFGSIAASEFFAAPSRNSSLTLMFRGILAPPMASGERAI